MKAIKNLACSTCFLLSMSTISLFAQDIDKHKALIENKVLKPIRMLHDTLSLIDAFSQAYTISSVWKYELLSKSQSKSGFYTYFLREYRGAFIIDQYKLRLYESESKVEIESWNTKKYLSSDSWLKEYKEMKLKKQ